MVRWFSFVVLLFAAGCGGADPSRVGLPLLAAPPVAEADSGAKAPAQDAGSPPQAPDAAPTAPDAQAAREDAGQAPDAADAADPPDAGQDAGEAPDAAPAGCVELSRAWAVANCLGTDYTAWDCSAVVDGKSPTPKGVGTCVEVPTGSFTYCCR